MRIQLPERWNCTADESLIYLNDLGGLLLCPAEPKGHSQAGDGYTSPRWFTGSTEVMDAPQSIDGTFITVVRCECCRGS